MELKRCPFCGTGREEYDKGVPILRVAHLARECGLWAVFCDGCGGRGPARMDEHKAIAAWNKRAKGE